MLTVEVYPNLELCFLDPFRLSSINSHDKATVSEAVHPARDVAFAFLH